MEFWLHRISSEDDDRVVASQRITLPRMTCGREGDFKIDSVKDPGSISRHHAFFEVSGNPTQPPFTLLLTDTSMNGVRLNGAPVSKNVPTVVFHGDIITFGTDPAELTFRVEIRGGLDEIRDATHAGIRCSSNVLRVNAKGYTRVETFEAIAEEQYRGLVAEDDRLATLTSYLCQRGHTQEVCKEGSTQEQRKSRAQAMLEYLSLVYDPVHDRFHHLLGPALLHDATAQLCADVEAILTPGSMLVEMESPLYVLGDIHGNYRDLRRILGLTLPFHNMNYSPARLLFLGDYVDRGDWGFEVVLHLLALHALYGSSDVVLLRGNHEDADINGDGEQYGECSFLTQLLRALGPEHGRSTWVAINRVFAHLPLSCVVDRSIFACHGGVPRTAGDARGRLLRDVTFPHFNHIMPVTGESPHRARLREIARDILWADPCEDESALRLNGFAPSHRANGNDAIAMEFGREALMAFLAEMGCDLLLRAHQHKSEGLRLAKGSKVVTVFSTSGYCSGTNSAGIVFVKDGEVNFITFEREPMTSPLPPVVKKAVTNSSPGRPPKSPVGGRVPKKLSGRPSS